MGWSRWDGRQRRNHCCSHQPLLQTEEERRCVGRSTGRPSIVSACLAAQQSTATSRGGGRATNNQHQRQQERATRGDRVSGCGNITINQKISFSGEISESGGNAAAAKMTVRATRAGATRRRQRGSTATTAARTGVARQQRRWRRWQQGPGQGRRGGNNSGESRGDTVTPAARTIARDTRPDEGNAVTVTRYHSDGGCKAGSDGGGESEGQCGNDRGVPRRWRRWR